MGFGQEVKAKLIVWGRVSGWLADEHPYILPHVTERNNLSVSMSHGVSAQAVPEIDDSLV